MNSSHLFRLLVMFSILSVLFWPVTSTGGKKGGGGKPGGSEPPAECSDVYPGFVYLSEDTRKSTGGIHLATSDGCRSDPIAVPQFRVVFGPLMDTSDDGQDVVIVWGEQRGENQPYDYRLERREFQVDGKGTAESSDDELVETASDSIPLPSAVSSGFPVGDEVYYFGGDLWADGNHDELYLVLYQLHRTLGTEVPNIRNLLVFDLVADPQLFQPVALSNEDCTPDVSFPQFVPGCYSFRDPRWNVAGDRIYVDSRSEDGQFSATLAVDVARNGGLLEDWGFSGARIVFAGSTDPFEPYGDPSGIHARPAPAGQNGGGGELLAIEFLDRSGNQTMGVRALLDVDLCSSIFAGLADGETAAGGVLWMDCLSPDWFTGGPEYSWQSDAALLVGVLGNGRGGRDLYRIHFRGDTAVSAELLLEGVQGADTGL